MDDRICNNTPVLGYYTAINMIFLSVLNKDQLSSVFLSFEVFYACSLKKFDFCSGSVHFSPNGTLSYFIRQLKHPRYI